MTFKENWLAWHPLRAQVVSDMFRFNQTTSYVPLKPLRETNGLHGSLYDILSDCYREVGPVSTVKRKTLWNVAANAA